MDALRNRQPWIVASLLGLLMQACAMRVAAQPPPPAYWSLMEDNDGMLSHHDQHYTQGLRLSVLTPRASPAENPEIIRQINWIVLGQSMFTPANTEHSPPNPADRPYAGWLYTGVDWLQADGTRDLNQFELLAGVIGPDAYARQTQNSFHTIFGFPTATGWSSQLGNRGAFQLSYDRHQRIAFALNEQLSADAIAEAGISVGNVMRYLDAGVTFRIGDALGADFGPEHIRPAASGGGYFNARALPSGRFHYAVFAGSQLRRVSYNRLIDGANELGTGNLDSIGSVRDYFIGTRAYFGPRIHADFTAYRRTREFDGQAGDDLFGTASLSIAW